MSSVWALSEDSLRACAALWIWWCILCDQAPTESYILKAKPRTTGRLMKDVAPSIWTESRHQVGLKRKHTWWSGGRRSFKWSFPPKFHQAPRQTAAILVDVCDSSRCRVSSLRWRYAASLLLMEAASSYTELLEPSWKSDTGKAWSIWSLFKIKHPVQPPDCISNHYLNITS